MTGGRTMVQGIGHVAFNVEHMEKTDSENKFAGLGE